MCGARGDPSLMQRFFAFTTAVVLCAAGLACGTESSTDMDDTRRADAPARENATTAEPPEPELRVTIDAPSDGRRVTAPSVKVRGTVSPADAGVKVNGRSMEVIDGEWSGRVDLELGDNGVRAVATAAGTTERMIDDVTVTRRRTAAQRAAFRAAQERKRQQRIADLKASANPIDPKLLQKNPDKHIGERVVVSGEIFQIQEDRGDGSFMMINTGCETTYDVRICDGPTVHIAYEGSNDKTEDDFVTVYGTVAGGLEYDTAIGGTNFVASVEADIIE